MSVMKSYPKSNPGLSKEQIEELATPLYGIMVDFYSQEGNLKRFEEWLKERNKESQSIR